MAKIFNVRQVTCEKGEYDENLRCKFESKKGRITKSKRGIAHAFIIKKPSERGDNLIASAYADKRKCSSSFYDKKCAIIQSKPIRGDKGEILVESQKTVVCSDSLKELKNKYGY